MLTNVSRPSAVDVLRPFAVGDTFYADTTSTLAKRTAGSANDVYTVSGGVPVWSSSISLTSLTVVDSGFAIVGSSDATKTIKFEVDAQTTGDDLTINSGAQTDDRTVSFPVLTGNRTLAVIDQAQTFTAAQTVSTQLGVGSAPSALAQLTIGGVAGFTNSVEIAAFCNFTSSSSATTALRGAQFSIATAAASFTCSEATAFLLGNNSAGSGSTITRSQGVWASIQSGGANNCGILHANSTGYSGNWFIYDEGTYDSQFGGQVRLPATTTSRASLRIPHGTAPSSPVDGDMWTTTAGLFVRINGATVGPLT